MKKLILLITPMLVVTGIVAAQKPSVLPTPVITEPGTNDSSESAEINPKSKETEKNDPGSSLKKDADADLMPTTGYTRPNAKQRFNRFVNNTVGPVALTSNAFSAGVTTWRNAPKEWGGDWEGFGRRFGSNTAKGAVKNGTIYALDEAMKLDSGFYLSKKRGPKSRFRNAFLSVVTARDKNGRRVFGTPRMAGSFASGLITSRTWYPERFGYEHGLKSGAISLLFDAGINLAREFMLKK